MRNLAVLALLLAAPLAAPAAPPPPPVPPPNYAKYYPGGATISAGTLQGDASSLLFINIVDNAALVFDQATAGIYNGSVSGTGSLTKEGSGTLTLDIQSTYTGATVINAGALVLGIGSNIAGTSGVAIAAGASFDVSGIGPLGTTIGALSGAGTVILGAKSLTVGTAADSTFDGLIEGPGGSLVKQGTSTLILTGANTYTGATTVNGGTLRAATLAGAAVVKAAPPSAPPPSPAP